MKKKFKKILINLALMGITLVVMLMLAELVLHLVSKPAVDQTLVRMYEFDPWLSWRPVANQRYQIKTDEFETEFVTNRYGFRGPDWSQAKPADTLRVVVLGDSFAEGQHVGYEALFSEQLKAMLEQAPELAGRRVEMINTGVCGYNTAQELEMFDRVARDFEPDLTILLVCYNDLLLNNRDWDAFHQIAIPHFEWQAGALTATNLPLEPVRERPFDRQPANTTWKSRLVSHSKLCQLLRDAVNNHHGLLTLAVKLGIKKLPAEMRRRPDGEIDPIPMDYYFWKTPYLDEIEQAWDITEKLMVELKARVQAAGSGLLVLNVPNLAEIEPAVLEDTRQKYGIPEDWDPHQIGRELGLRCAGNGIECLWQIEPWLAKAGELEANDEMLYFVHNGHWNEAGHRFVAELLYPAVMKLLTQE